MPLVLVADDDPATRFLLREALSQEGFQVVEAADGDEALALTTAAAPDILLLDVEMPTCSGFEVCHAVREQLQASAPPIVMVTSHDDRHSIDRAYDAGATDFISKPISWPLIGHRLRYILRGARNLRALTTTLEENRALMAALPDNIYVVDGHGAILGHMRGQDASLDAADPDARNSLADLFPAELGRSVQQKLESVLAGGEQACVEYRSSLARPNDWRECRLVDHGNGHALAIVRDITERKAAEARIHQLAFYDVLTGLPNRSLFSEQAGNRLAEGQGRVAVFAIDLDRFRRINDTLGTDVGDLTLQEAASRLSATIASFVDDKARRSPPLDVCLARFGGNTFALMLAGDLKATDLVDVSQELAQSVARPMRIRDHEFVVTASVGVACSPVHGRTIEALLRNAEAARAEAKMNGSNAQRLYRSSMNAEAAEFLNLETDLRRAIENDELVIHYQPKYSTESDALCGAEALLRWTHPTRGVVSPSVFVRIAEEAGFVDELGARVMHGVCQQISAWRYAGRQTVPIAVNLSGREFVTGNPLRSAIGAVRRAGIEPGAIEIEITETVLMSDIRSVVATLHDMREAGFRLAVDDFGTGYSSLRYLQRFPVDVLKIDSSFVRHVEADADSRAICSAIIALARSLRLEVVGEGVATPWQRSFLRREGCDVLQGFLLGRPMPSNQFEKLLGTSSPKRVVDTPLRMVN